MGDSGEVRELLDNAISRLPSQARQWIITQVNFVVVGSAHGHGQTLPQRFLRGGSGYPDPGELWVVFLSEDGLLGVDVEEAHSLVAHEAAHAYLGESASERSVAEQVREWGFTGAGADPERY